MLRAVDCAAMCYVGIKGENATEGFKNEVRSVKSGPIRAVSNSRLDIQAMAGEVVAEEAGRVMRRMCGMCRTKVPGRKSRDRL